MSKVRPKTQIEKDFDEFFKLFKGRKKRKFRPSILIDQRVKCLDIILEDCAYYFEWIKGEGGDIGLYRAVYACEDKKAERVIGARLPFAGNPKDIKLIIN